MICVGNVRIKEITTKTGRMGMMTDGVYVDNGAEVAGYIDILQGRVWCISLRDIL